MFGSKKTLNALMAQLRPDLSRDSLDVETADGITFRGIADEDLTITELTRLAPGQTLPVRYRPTVIDHYLALARDADPIDVQQLSDEIASRKQT
ncbi:hypothetical protein [Rhodococcus pyridinivorans]|uniref:hypothetical protein n=1 Tax=Rhodococcus pyridinivorans TaxID=103816 RepID=UPI002284F34C|nr:hypothetical protein [Rhodococcus pyridinivorans]WAL49296.1 hypothetical protein OQN32_26905 [Rhodococcus pyridinivorans]